MAAPLGGWCCGIHSLKQSHDNQVKSLFRGAVFGKKENNFGFLRTTISLLVTSLALDCTAQFCHSFILYANPG